MRKILAILFVGLTVPAICLAAGAGGSANPYHLEVAPIVWRTSGTTNYDSTTITLVGTSGGFSDLGACDTSLVMDASTIVCPMGASAFMGFMASFAAGTAALDTVGLFMQWSPDGSTWFGVNTKANVPIAIPTACLSPTTFNANATTPTAYVGVVEAATLATMPMWKQVRFLIQHFDAASIATTVGSVKVWWARYVKDE